MLRSSTGSPAVTPQADTNSTQQADSDASRDKESVPVDNTETKSDSTAAQDGLKADLTDQREADGCMADQSTINIPEITVTDESTPAKDAPEVDDKPPGGSGEDAMEHLFPATVDTSLVEGTIVKVSALIEERQYHSWNSSKNHVHLYLVYCPDF